MNSPTMIITAALLLSAVDMAVAQSPSTAGEKFFESKIRPVLVKHCYECHSRKSGKSKGGLRVDSRDALQRGGDTGPAIVPKSVDKSLLYGAILYHEDSFQMPPKGKLSNTIIADFRRWIQLGAPDPRVTKISPDVKTEIDLEKGRNYWAYRPPVQKKAKSSPNSNWAKTEIDKYIISSLDQHKLQPVADANATTLVRRLYFVITGLPASLKEGPAWIRKIESTRTELERRSVIAQLIDALLDTPQFGERWGRHWLDVARYAESTGGDQNNIFQHAWRYRDYVIDSFNNDKPYDEFVCEQIAGDLLPIANDREWAEHLVATGFLTLGVKLVGEEDQQKFLTDLVDEQIDTTTRAFLATTVACARCHDHKFNPIPQNDYYALAGIFRSTETHYGLLKAQARQATTLLDATGMGLPPGSPTLSRDELAELTKKRDDAAKAVSDAMAKIRSGENVFRGTLRRLRSQRDETEAALQAYSQKGNPRVFVMGTQDRNHPLPTRLLVRGEIDKPAQLIHPGVLQVLSEPGLHTIESRKMNSSILSAFRSAELGSTAYGVSGRLHLAQWIASEKNPLTARVMANRIWAWMFGRGLVRTVDDFGHAGEMPSHPELLDYLAMQFVEENWSIKSMIREIALSRTWQLSSDFDERNVVIDPENRFLWRMNKRRLEAEAIRDAMLQAAGNLELKRPAGTYLRKVGEGGVGQNVFEPEVRAIQSNTRSVYLPRVRSVLPEMMEVFDAPDASLVTGMRETTSSPLQSLYLLNNEFAQEQAGKLARRLESVPASSRVETAYQMILGRSPTEAERRLGNEFLSSMDKTRVVNTDTTKPAATEPGRGFRGRGFGEGRGRLGSEAAEAIDSDNSEKAPMTRLEMYCQALLCTSEFYSID